MKSTKQPAGTLHLQMEIAEGWDDVQRNTAAARLRELAERIEHGEWDINEGPGAYKLNAFLD